ncbi:hypothetical protein [Pseudoalteromonas xiamenensis]
MEFDLKKSLVDPKNNADIILKPARCTFGKFGTKS